MRRSITYSWGRAPKRRMASSTGGLRHLSKPSRRTVLSMSTMKAAMAGTTGARGAIFCTSVFSRISGGRGIEVFGFWLLVCGDWLFVPMDYSDGRNWTMKTRARGSTDGFVFGYHVYTVHHG